MIPSRTLGPYYDRGAVSDCLQFNWILGTEENITTNLNSIMGNLEKQRYREAFAKALRLFGNESDAYGWLNEPSFPLGDVTPLSLLSTAQGFELVLYELSQMEFGHPV